jgi:hypothetical protein
MFEFIQPSESHSTTGARPTIVAQIKLDADLPKGAFLKVSAIPFLHPMKDVLLVGIPAA